MQKNSVGATKEKIILNNKDIPVKSKILIDRSKKQATLGITG